MKVYLISCEGESRIVEAESYGRAVTIWTAAMIREFGPDSGWTTDTEPESVELLSDEPVIRAEHKITVQEAAR